MIKDNNKPLFHPTFGSRPAQIVGRTQVIEDFAQGLREPIGSRERCRFYIGQRGMGKTALLLELADVAAEMDYVTASVTAYSGMNEDIIETVQRNGAKYIVEQKRKITGASGGALGFSFGLTFSDEVREQYGFRAKLAMLCDELERHGKGLLILVDEATTSEEMRQLAITYQHLVGEEKNIAIVMAGLPHAVSGVLNDSVLTFLNRAYKSNLGPIKISEIKSYYTEAFKKLGLEIKESDISKAAEATKGFPYMMQLVGYYIMKKNNSAVDIDEIVNEAKEDMVSNVFEPILRPLSDNDREFLVAMAVDEKTSKISAICKRLGKSNSYIQPYRARMIEAGIIEAPRTGEVVFAVPYLAEYLRANQLEKSAVIV